MKVTMKDIAERTGYSISTVSRVLSNSSRISNKAKEEIFQAARKLNYKFSPITSSERSAWLQNIALITDFHEGEFYSSFFYGFLQATREKNIRLSLLNVYNPHEEMETFIKDIVSEGYFDGIILFVPELTQSEYISILKQIPRDFPIVSNALIDNPKITTITFDGYSGGTQAAQHLDKIGLQKVGIIKGPRSKAESRFRSNGFRDYITNTDHMQIIWEYEGNFEYPSGIKAFENLMATKLHPEGIFVSNDLMATAFIGQAKSKGLKIPEDMAIISYDDLPLCVQNVPTITSINTDFTRLGLYTIQQLEVKLKGGTDGFSALSLIPVELIPRESTLKNKLANNLSVTTSAHS